MGRTVFFLVLSLHPIGAHAQPAIRLSLKQAIELAVSPGSSASVQLAEASVQIAEAHLSQAHSLLYPVLESQLTEQNQTRNLSAQGFNFATGDPNFTIPESVGPFSTFDARVFMTQNVLDLSALRRNRGLRARLDAARADTAVNRDHAAAQAAHDYLVALRADAAIDAARAGVTLADALLELAQDREAAGKAAGVEITRAKLRLATDRRHLATAEGERVQAGLQLMSDLGLDFAVPLELTGELLFRPDAISDKPDTSAAVAAALESRAELQASQKRAEEARSNDSAIRLERMPSVSAYGDVGGLASVITHTVGVTVRIPLFDGGRRESRHAEALAIVRQSEIQERDLRRQIELQTRRASARVQASALQIAGCDEALTLAEEEVSQARRRFEGGVTGNIDVVESQARLAQARDDRIAIVFTWNQARADLAQATGAITSFALPDRQ